MEHLKHWLNDLLDETNQNKNLVDLLKSCGEKCAKRNGFPNVVNLRAEISGLQTMEEISRVICKHTGTGVECTPFSNGFIYIDNNKDCICPIVKGGYVISTIFCNCTLGYHEFIWSEVFEKPITVELLSSFLNGGKCCSVKIYTN